MLALKRISNSIAGLPAGVTFSPRINVDVSIYLIAEIIGNHVAAQQGWRELITRRNGKPIDQPFFAKVGWKGRVNHLIVNKLQIYNC